MYSSLQGLACLLLSAYTLVDARALPSTDLSMIEARAASAKRGLVYIPRDGHPEDDAVWIQSGSSITWYYNYGPDAAAAYKNSKLLFVPMIFGPYYNDFQNNTRAKLKAGTKIPFILSYNEPDLPYEYGGSQAEPEAAAAHWISELEPLRRDFGVALGAPAVSGSEGGYQWMQKFFTACNGRCRPSFWPLHYYGGFQGFADHIGRARGTYQNMTLWVTEWAPDHESLADTQSNFNTSVQYLDRLSYVDKYAYFGSFRSDVSNVGANATMLDDKGKLTAIGATYVNVPR